MKTKKGLQRKIKKEFQNEVFRAPEGSYVLKGEKLTPRYGARTVETFGSPNGGGFHLTVAMWLDRVANGQPVDQRFLAPILGVKVSQVPASLRELGYGR